MRTAEAVDLLSPNGERALLDRVTDVACGATVELGPSTLAEPAALADLTVLFRGTREDGVLFELRSTYARHLVLVTAPPDTAFDASRLFLAFDLGVWLDSAGIPDLTPVGGAIAVDASHEPAALAAFDAASAHAVALYFDANGDGQLTDAELTPVAIPE